MRTYNKSRKKGKKNLYMAYSIFVKMPFEDEKLPVKVKMKGRDHKRYVLCKYHSKIMGREVVARFSK